MLFQFSFGGLSFIRFLEKYPQFQNKYVQSLLILIIAIFLSRFVTFVIEKFIKRITTKTKTDIDDRLIEECRTPFVYLLIFFGVKIALVPLEMGAGIYTTIAHINNTILYLLVFYMISVASTIIISGAGKKWANRTKSSIDDELIPIFLKVSKILIIILTIIFVLKEWAIDISGLLAGVGLAGLAIGFAVKDSLANIFGGISLILDKAIKVGDVIQTDSGEMGTVIDVGLRSTRIRTWDNELIVIPNGTLANSKIQNYKLPDLSIRIIIKFGVEYGSDIEKVKKTVLAALKKIPKCVLDNKKKAPRVYFMNMGDSALEFRAQFWVNDYSDKFVTKEKANCEIYNALSKSKIGIPFPTRTVYLKKV